MSLIIMLVVGGIIGWLASIVMKTDGQMGWIANIVVGIVGSGLGFWIAGLLGIPADGVLRYVIAFAGAALLIFILGKIGVFKRA